MPVARPPLDPVAPLPLTVDEAEFAKQTIARWFGENAVVRSFGFDPDRVDLHVEAERLLPNLALADCVGILYTRIDRRRGLKLYQSKRGGRVAGEAKIAYRQE